jgi:polysaccharide biosynthesis protein PslJ
VNNQPWMSSSEQRSPTLHIVIVALLGGAVLGVGVAFLSPLMAIMGLLGLTVAIAIFVRPELGLLGFVAVSNLLPFAVIPIRFGLSLTLVDAVLTTLLAAWLYWAIQRGRPLAASALNFPILIYLGLALASFVLGLTYSISPERLRLFIKSVNSILFFFSVLNCVRSIAELRRAVTALLVCGAVAAGIAIVLQYLPQNTTIQILSALGPLGYPTGADVLRPIADTDIPRAIGTSVDPNVLGGLLMLTSSLLVGQLLSQTPVLPRKLLVPMIALALVALLLTHSRSAFGGFIVGAIVVGTFHDRRLLLLVAFGLAALFFLPRDWVFVDRIFSGLAFEDRASLMRLDEYRDAINLIGMYPWFGIGFGEPPSINLYLGVSSMYLLVGQEMGLLGLAAFLTIGGVLAWQVVAGIKEATDEVTKGLLVGLCAALAAAAAAGLLDHYFVNIVFPHMIAVFWLYAGLAAVAARLARTPPPGPGKAIRT